MTVSPRYNSPYASFTGNPVSAAKAAIQSNPTNNNNTASNIIDEDQLARTFQEIINCINLDDEETTSNASSGNGKS